MKITSKDIILDTDERIRMQSEPVQLPLSNEDRELLQAMLDYVRNSQDDEIAEAEGLQTGRWYCSCTSWCFKTNDCGCDSL